MAEAVKKDLGREEFTTWFTELQQVEKEIEFNISNLKTWMQEISVDTPVLIGPAKSKIVYEPLGVVCIIGSWNYPIFTTLGPLVNAIAAGNCAVIKPSEIAPYTLLKLKSFVIRNLDMSSYVCIEGQIEVSKALTATKFDLICFTGSSEKGKLVAASAAQNLVPCILELGGKSPSIVDESADIAYAAKKIAFGRFINCGQTCVAPDYVLVHYSKVEKFVSEMNKAIKDIWQEGKNTADMGHMVNEFHTNRVCSLLKDHQGNVLIGNANAHEDKNLTPTVVLNPSKDSPLMKDEIFGPILPLFSFNHIDEAIKMVKEFEKPLVIYYFGSVISSNAAKV